MAATLFPPLPRRIGAVFPILPTSVFPASGFSGAILAGADVFLSDGGARRAGTGLCTPLAAAARGAGWGRLGILAAASRVTSAAVGDCLTGFLLPSAAAARPACWP